MSKQHILKIHPQPLAELLSGAKTAEVRRNDRGFQVGDTVRLMEVNPETLNWTGRPDIFRTISHIQTGYGLPDGLCVLSYAQPAAGDPVYQWHDETAWQECNSKREYLHAKDNGLKVRTLWTAPPAAAPVAAGEPVAWADNIALGRIASGRSVVTLSNVETVEYSIPLFRVSPPAAAHGDEAVRKDATEAVMQRACAELPKDFYIEIHLENGSGYATLFNDGIVVDFGQDFESIGAQVEAALDDAMRAQGNGGNDDA